MHRSREEIEHWPRLDGRALWRHSRAAAAPEDEAERLLDLAGFADGRLDPDEHERVANLLADDTNARADVAAARALARGIEASPAGLEGIILRAVALVPAGGATPARVASFAGARRHAIFRGFAQWTSLAAAVALAGWLGFAMGSDASRALSPPHQAGEAAFLPELFDPGSSFLRDPVEDSRT
ncbi:MAG TPA: hypothetical protein VGF07_04130 [Stellaceae bacterium]